MLISLLIYLDQILNNTYFIGICNIHVFYLKMSQQQLVNKLCCGFNWWCKFSSERHYSVIKLDANSFMYYLYLYYIVIHMYVCITITVHYFVFIESNLTSRYLLASKNNHDLQRSRSRTSQQYLTSGKQKSITKLTDGNEIVTNKMSRHVSAPLYIMSKFIPYGHMSLLKER